MYICQMASYKGLVEINGQVGDFVFYQLNGKQIVRRKSGFNGEAYKNDPKYAKVRENSSEFGNASKAGKMLRTLLADYLPFAEDKFLYQKFAQLMTRIKDLDKTSARGKRKIDVGFRDETSLKMLKEFTFGKVENWQNSATRTTGLFTDTITIKDAQKIDNIGIVVIHPDFTLNTGEKAQQFLPAEARRTVYEFEKFFADTDATTLLYFLVARKGEEVVRMGFI